MKNQLIDETSPYLRQHADNPVHWQTWNPDALDQAREHDKPILLSIGYSACHWCHVMAHESFEDEDTAALMNAHFINIKVDREERPDIDKIYQLTHQIMTQRPGGWPLTMILDPKTHAPFMAGTYFPRQASHGMPAFPDVLRQVAQWYDQNKHQLDGQKQQLDEVLERLRPSPCATVGDDAPIKQARTQLQSNFDASHGGFSDAPKFPHPASIDFLLRLANRGDDDAREMAYFTLQEMASGGLQDQIGGGFYRYSVDESWTIPHFEKMLYDNGPLLALYAACSGHDQFAATAEATASWAIREMQSNDGGFYSSLDADSEGEEGRFYVWTPEQIRTALADHPQADAVYELLQQHYGLDREPNFEGRYHLNIARSEEELTQDRAESRDAIGNNIEFARDKLFHTREQRIRPDLDDKCLTAWNALMIQGLAVAGLRLQRPAWIDAAIDTADFLHSKLWQDNRLLASYKNGVAAHPGYLDDYAFLLDAMLDLLQAHWRSDYCDWARQLADALLEHFEDTQNGGFYFTAHDSETVLHRLKPLGDESTPAGNGIAARALLRLGWLLSEPRYIDAAERCLKYARNACEKFPLAHISLIAALDDYLNPPEVVIIRGTGDDLAQWQRAAAGAGRLASRLIFAIPADATDLPQGLADKKARDETLAYICRGFECSAPVTEPEKLIKPA